MTDRASEFFGVQRRADALDHGYPYARPAAAALIALVVLLVLLYPLRAIDAPEVPVSCVPHDVRAELEPGSVRQTTTNTSAACHRIVIDVNTASASATGVTNISDCPGTTHTVERVPVWRVVATFHDCETSASSLRHFLLKLAETSNATRGEELADAYRGAPLRLYSTGIELPYSVRTPFGVGVVLYWTLAPTGALFVGACVVLSCPREARRPDW